VRTVRAACLDCGWTAGPSAQGWEVTEKARVHATESKGHRVEAERQERIVHVLQWQDGAVTEIEPAPAVAWDKAWRKDCW